MCIMRIMKMMIMFKNSLVKIYPNNDINNSNSISNNNGNKQQQL